MSEELASLGTPVWLDTAVWTSQIAFIDFDSYSHLFVMRV